MFSFSYKLWEYQLGEEEAKAKARHNRGLQLVVDSCFGEGGMHGPQYISKNQNIKSI